MSDRQWHILQITTAAILMIAAFTLTYFLQDEGTQLLLLGNPWFKWPIILTCLAAIYFIILIEIRVQTKKLSVRTFGITFLAFCGIGLFFWLIRP